MNWLHHQRRLVDKCRIRLIITTVVVRSGTRNVLHPSNTYCKGIDLIRKSCTVLKWIYVLILAFARTTPESNYLLRNLMAAPEPRWPHNLRGSWPLNTFLLFVHDLVFINKRILEILSSFHLATTEENIRLSCARSPIEFGSFNYYPFTARSW